MTTQPGTLADGFNGRKGSQWIVFNVGETEYLVDSAQIVQIEMVENVTSVPNTEPYVRGVAYLRGQVVPVVDLRVRLGLPATQPGLESRIIVIGSSARPVGLMVDSAREVIYLEKSAIAPPPEIASASGATHVSGIAVSNNRVLLVLDVDAVLQASLKLAPQSEVSQAIEQEGHTQGRESS